MKHENEFILDRKTTKVGQNVLQVFSYVLFCDAIQAVKGTRLISSIVVVGALARCVLPSSI